jgi:hypothetical protein
MPSEQAGGLAKPSVPHFQAKQGAHGPTANPKSPPAMQVIFRVHATHAKGFRLLLRALLGHEGAGPLLGLNFDVNSSESMKLFGRVVNGCESMWLPAVIF